MQAAAPILCALLATLQAPTSTLGDAYLGTRVRGIDLAGEAGSWRSWLASQGTHPGNGYTYGESAPRPSSQYNGRVFDPGTGFHDYGARMYWPQIGRFISADSYAGTPGDPASLNRYCYVNNNPYKYTDPTGHCPMCIGAAIGAVGGGILAGYYSYQSGVRGEGLVGDILFGIGAGGLVGGTLGAGAAALPALLNRSSSLQRLTDSAPAVEAEAAAASEGLSAGQAANLARFEGKLPSAAGDTVVRNLPSGSKAFQATVPGRVPGSAAVYEKQVDAAGKTLQYTKTTTDPAGALVHVKDKINGTVTTP